MDAKSVTVPRTSMYAWVVWGLGAAFFFCDYFARVSPGVMVTDLIDAFQATAYQLGLLSAFFYYPYIFMQIPAGILVDKFGVRRLLFCMSFVTGFGCFLFGSANLLHIAQMGRFLIGFGAAFAFVSTLKLAAEWFPPSRFGLLAGLTQALGMLGAWVGEAPVAQLVTLIGWRETMFVMAAIFAVLSSSIFIIVRDNDFNQKKHSVTDEISTVLHSLVHILKSPQAWMNALYAGLVFAPTAVFAELWGPTYLQYVQEMSHLSAAAATGMVFLGWGIGGPLFGFISDALQARRPVMFLSASTGAMLLALILFFPDLPDYAMFFLLFLYGISNAGVAIAYAVACELSPRRFAGVSIAFANMMSVLVGAILQPVVGMLIDQSASSRIIDGVATYVAGDFTFAMCLLPLSLVLAMCLSLMIRETHCRQIVN